MDGGRCMRRVVMTGLLILSHFPPFWHLGTQVPPSPLTVALTVPTLPSPQSPATASWVGNSPTRNGRGGGRAHVHVMPGGFLNLWPGHNGLNFLLARLFGALDHELCEGRAWWASRLGGCRMREGGGRGAVAQGLSSSSDTQAQPLVS